ncbi:MAG: hypothetical protein QM639_20015 [Rhodocyclaceae bacterium]|jgi:hypothetical protein
MPARDHAKTPLQRLIECAVVAGGMALSVLLLMRGKVLIALLLAALSLGVITRLGRAWRRLRRPTR